MREWALNESDTVAEEPPTMMTGPHGDGPGLQMKSDGRQDD